MTRVAREDARWRADRCPVCHGMRGYMRLDKGNGKGEGRCPVLKKRFEVWIAHSSKGKLDEEPVSI